MRLRTHSASFLPRDVRRHGADLFLASALILFLAQVSLRWFPEQVVELDRVPNVVLLACLLGPALGCLAAGRARRLIIWTPLCLALALILATVPMVEWAKRLHLPTADIIPGLFFVLIALTLAGPGQELGRALNKMLNRLLAFTLILLGSAAGLALFAGCTSTEFGPFWWFLVVVLGVAYFMSRHVPAGLFFGFGVRPVNWGILAGTLGLIGGTSFPFLLPGGSAKVLVWSPYGKLEYHQRPWAITVHAMNDQAEPDRPHVLPFLMNRDAGGQHVRNVLILGAGLGQEIHQALSWGAERVDAVEVDPVILRFGRQDNPDHVYQDPRVTVRLGDGRRFLRTCRGTYDLILYNLADSPLPPVGPEDCRRVRYLLTRQALTDVHRCLTPHGMFALSSWIREGWFSARLRQSLEEVFPEPPLVVSLTSRPDIQPRPTASLALFLAGDTAHWRRAFQENDSLDLWNRQNPYPKEPNGVTPPSADERAHIADAARLAAVDTTEYLDTPEDDWPFLFLRRRTIPEAVGRGLIVLVILSVVLLWAFRSASPLPALYKALPLGLVKHADPWPFYRLEMFCLGAGFMLTATAIRGDALLLFGDTWIIGTAATLAVFALLLGARGAMWVLNPARLWPLYTALLVTLVLHRLFPLDHVLRHGPGLRAAVAYLLGLAPVLFAGMIFAFPFQHSAEPARDGGAVLAGAVLGAMLGTLALAWGFHSLILVALGSFALAAVPSARWALWQYDRRYPPAEVPLRTPSWSAFPAGQSGWKA